MAPPDLISTKDLIDFGKRHGVPLGRTTPYRTLNFYIQQGLLPRKQRYSDGRIRWGFPRSAQAHLLRLRDLKRQGLRLREIREKIHEDLEREHERREKAPSTLGSPDEPSNQSDDFNTTYYHERAKEARDLLGAGLTGNVKLILDDLIDLMEPAFLKGELTILVVDGPRTTQIHRVASADAADYLCDVFALEPWALEQWYGTGWFHAVIPGVGTPAFAYEVLIPDAETLPYAPCPTLKKQGPTTHCMEGTPLHEYQIYRVNGAQSEFLCQDSLWRVTPEVLAREYGAGKFRLVLEQPEGTRSYGLIITHPPVSPEPEQFPGGRVVRAFDPRGAQMRRPPPAQDGSLKAKCPRCNRLIMKPDGEAIFLSTNGARYDPRTHRLQIRCKHCKTPMTIILQP